MAKFNATISNLTTNNEGHVAFAMDDKQKLVSMVLTSFYNEEKFYGDTSEELLALAEGIAKTNPSFLACLAVYARKEFHLRSVSHALTGVLAHEEASKPYVQQVVDLVTERADDLLEILAFYIHTYGKPIPNGLKKALGKGLKKFNEFQISKYNGGKHEVKFKDILNLTHVKPDTEEQSLLFKKILEDNLATATRWETELSAKGNNKETWEELLNKNQVSYMALLKNLRNIANANVSNMNLVNDKIMNRDEILKSKQLPFRFFSAYKELARSSAFTTETKRALEAAIGISMENVAKIPGKTVIAYDRSGSMSSGLSYRSTVQCSDISALLAVMAAHVCEEYKIYAFDTYLEEKNVSPYSLILQTTQSLAECRGGTDLSLPLKEMMRKKINADRLIIISDNEINYGYRHAVQHLADEYRKNVNPNLWIHAIDLQGYGTQQFKGDRTNIIAGWSEKVLDFIALAEAGTASLITAIEGYVSFQ